MITEDDRATLQRLVLLACKERALSMQEIEGREEIVPFVEKYKREAIRDFIRALAKTSLLYQSRTTNTAVYRSTADAGKLLGG